MNSAAIAKLLKTLSPDIIELNEDVLLNAGKRRPLLRRTPLTSAGVTGIDSATPVTPELTPELTPEPSNKRKILEDRFLGNWTMLGGPQLQREYRFDTERRWRFDFVVVGVMIAFEIQGGLYAPQTGHRSQEGVERDYEKLNAAQMAGWQVFQISSKSVNDTKLLQKLIDYCLRLT